MGAGDLLVELLVDHGVDAADEEARHARDMRGIAAAGDVFFQAGNVGFGHLEVDRFGE